MNNWAQEYCGGGGGFITHPHKLYLVILYLVSQIVSQILPSQIVRSSCPGLQGLRHKHGNPRSGVGRISGRCQSLRRISRAHVRDPGFDRQATIAPLEPALWLVQSLAARPGDLGRCHHPATGADHGRRVSAEPLAGAPFY